MAEDSRKYKPYQKKNQIYILYKALSGLLFSQVYYHIVFPFKVELYSRQKSRTENSITTKPEILSNSVDPLRVKFPFLSDLISEVKNSIINLYFSHFKTQLHDFFLRDIKIIQGLKILM